jgi:hypothetical protein
MEQPVRREARGRLARQGIRRESRIRMGEDLTKQGSTVKPWFVRSDAIEGQRVEGRLKIVWPLNLSP